MERKYVVTSFVAGALLFIGAGCLTANKQTTVHVDTSEELAVEVTEASEEEQTEDSADVDVYEGWETYTNEEYGFSLRYPNDWSIRSGYDSDSQKIILEDSAREFRVEELSQLSKPQGFTPGMSILFKFDDEMDSFLRELSINADIEEKVIINGFNATQYNRSNIIYEVVTVISRKNMIVLTHTDEAFKMNPIFESIYKSIELY